MCFTTLQRLIELSAHFSRQPLTSESMKLIVFLLCLTNTTPQRLIELSAHFSRQPLASERGSPFFPLFSPSTVSSKDAQASQQLLAPTLGRVSRADVHAETPLPQGW